MLILLTIPSLVLWLVLFFTYKSIASYKNGMLFAVTLPQHAMEHPRLQDIRNNYMKVFKRTFTGLIIAYIPLLFMMEWLAVTMIYFFIWMIATIIASAIPYRKAFRATLELKREQDWFVGKKKLIQADLRAAQLKNIRSAPLLLFLIPLAGSILLTLWAGSQEQTMYGVGIASIVTTFIFLAIVFLQRRSRSTVYSENSEINIALNQHKRRLVSYMFWWLAIIENIHFYLLNLLLLSENESSNQIWLYAVIGFSLIPLAIVLLVYQRIATMRREMLALDSSPVYSDDDEYWSNGFTYHNPYDNSFLVPKRVGIGETINTGTLAGKIVMGGIVGIFFAVIIGVSFLLIQSELSTPTLTINDQENIEIDYPMYSYSFSLQDIEALDLVENIPSGVKTNGEATNKVARGHFRLKELGKARLYVFKNNPPYIQIKLDDQYIFYNDNDPTVTKQLYDQLQAKLIQ